MSEKTILSASTLAGTLAGYYLAQKSENRIPSMLIGGFIGTLISELITKKKAQPLSGRKPMEDHEVLGI